MAIKDEDEQLLMKNRKGLADGITVKRLIGQAIKITL